MSATLTPGVDKEVDLLTTVTSIVSSEGHRPHTLVLWESDVDVIVVTSTHDDGDAVPADGAVTIAAANMPWEMSIKGKGYLGLAGDGGTGTVRVSTQ